MAAGASLALLPVGGGGATPEESTSTVRNGAYLQPNIQLPDGRSGYAHVTEEDMPLRISLGRPKSPPRYGSSSQAREAAIDAMRDWESAIQKRVPWFALEFASNDSHAPVQIRWKRRITGPWGGFGRLTISTEHGRLRVRGEIQISTTPSPFVTLGLKEVERLVAHEFGHVLGLGHCLDCDSAMNYAWHTRNRVVVTDLDVETFVRLIGIPNGTPAE